MFSFYESFSVCCNFMSLGYWGHRDQYSTGRIISYNLFKNILMLCKYRVYFTFECENINNIFENVCIY